MQIIINLLLSTVAVIISAYVLPGVKVDSFLTAVVVAVVLGIINAVIKPILIVVTLPINIITLGLFTFIINGIIILLVSAFVPGFKVQGFLWAILFSIVLSIVSWFISSLKF
ncbi:MAG TPA: phage holin family protein [Patescibacteria group bacterium]